MARVESVSRAFGGPMRYIQGPDEIYNLKEYTSIYGENVCVLIDGFLFDDFKIKIKEIYDESTNVKLFKFGGECCDNEIEKLVNESKEMNADIFVGIGSGKTLDTGKAVAEILDIPRIIVPTSASSDAPTSSISIIYTPEGVHDRAIRLKRGTEIVLVDSKIIAKAPVRLLVAGMGDAISTVFEAHANAASDSPNFIGKGYRSCKMSIAIAELCFEIVLRDGRKAKKDVENGLCTEALENIIEANTLLSGLGFENTGCSTGHGVHAGISEIKEADTILHGEKVAFGVVCQMVLENTDTEIVEEVMEFFIDVGLPVTLEELNIEPTEENLKKITDKVFYNNPYVHTEPFKVVYDQVYDAILSADLMGKSYKNK